MEELELPKAEISILLLDDAEIAGLNRQYLRRDGPTDVISFPMHDKTPGPDVHPDILGDVVISLETADRQARGKRHGFYMETACLLVHGILHLIGYDHEGGDKDALEMEKMETSVLEKVSEKCDIKQ